MSAFDKVIGYDSIKNELLQICDMVDNRSLYERLGAKMPHGILLYGDPGLGKTLIARCFIEKSGLNAYTVRRTKGTADFVAEITDTFRRARETAPSIVLLDDLDKFANEDERHCDAEEYVAVQAGIDEVSDADVFVFATANAVDRLPSSLTRSGRFDRKLEVNSPTAKDAEAIIRHYMRGKLIGADVDIEDITRMICYNSCAELETILNEAAIIAAYARRGSISMEDMVKAVLRLHYYAPDSCGGTTDEGIQRTAMHEAGHVVVCEVLRPGSVGMASIRSMGGVYTDGFVHRCLDFAHESHSVLVSLAGKAAVELYYSEDCADGCQHDIRRAFKAIRTAMLENGACGMGMVHASSYRLPNISEDLNGRSEVAVHAELERYMLKTRDILLKNRTFLEKTAAALAGKETLLYSDIRALRESAGVVSVDA